MAPIPIYVSNQQGYIWSVEDAARLRSEHHICGSLIGTLPSAAQQNVFLGLPLLLMPEEVVLLVEQELAVLIDDPLAHLPPTPGQLHAWDVARRASIQQQLSAREEKERQKDPVQLDSAAVRKREEREARRARERAEKAQRAAELGVEEAEAGPSPAVAKAPTPAPGQDQPNPPVGKDPAPHWVTLPSPSLPLPWYSPSPNTHRTLASALSAGLWSYPSTPHQRAKCAAFKALHDRGYFMGPGLKFGGDWLVYPGDPLRYHSHFVATAYATSTSPSEEGQGEGVSPLQIIAFGRLGTGTRKAHLLCGWDERRGEVEFFSVEWANFG